MTNPNKLFHELDRTAVMLFNHGDNHCVARFSSVELATEYLKQIRSEYRAKYHHTHAYVRLNLEKQLFTITSREWDGGSEITYRDYQVWASDRREARSRFVLWAKSQKDASLYGRQIISVTETRVIK